MKRGRHTSDRTKKNNNDLVRLFIEGLHSNAPLPPGHASKLAKLPAPELKKRSPIYYLHLNLRRGPNLRVVDGAGPGVGRGGDGGGSVASNVTGNAREGLD